MYQDKGNIAIKKDLKNIRLLTTQLGSPQESFPSIHIAGTNGKGTTAHLISAIFQARGQKVGLYTSPHYLDFRERIKVNGEYVPKKFVVNFVTRIKDAIEDINPSFFEITVAMAFSYFQHQGVDIAVIETGLGGRLDSTNIIDPVLSVITNISLDHTQILGSDHYSIAAEKAGIIKPHRPLVIGAYQSSCDHVFIQAALNNKCPISFASINWTVSKENDDHYLFTGKWTKKNYLIPISNLSPFDLENIITCMEAIHVYHKSDTNSIDEKSILNGISEFRRLTSYTGRWQVLGKAPLIIADSAHNPQALKIVLKSLRSLNIKKKHFVLGFVKGKDIGEILRLFDPQDEYYFTQPSVARRLESSELLRYSDELKMNGSKYENVDRALAEARKNANNDDLIYVGGSSFIVADVLSHF